MKYNANFDLDFNTSLFIKQYWLKIFPDYGKNYDSRLEGRFPPDKVEAFRAAKSEEEIGNIYKDHLVKSRMTELGPIIAAGVEKILNDNSDEIADKLVSLYEKEIPFEDVEVKVTYSLGNPFGYGNKIWHCTGYTFSPDRHIKTSIHELNHVMFYRLLYQDIKQKYGIDDDWIGVIKEGLTYLTDPEAHDDRPKVAALREYVLNMKGKKIEDIIDRMIVEEVGKK